MLRLALVLGISVCTALAQAEVHTLQMQLLTVLPDKDQKAQEHNAALRLRAGRDKDPSASAAALLALAKRGFVPSQGAIARLYETGDGVGEDLAAARQWYTKASAGGLLDAAYNLAVLTLTGAGGPPNVPRAIKLLRSAAQKGHIPSAFTLGEIYESGSFIPRNIADALGWYKKAAVESSGANLRLAQLYSEGKDVAKDDALADRYFEAAADLGQRGLRAALCDAFLRGKGVAQSFERAAAWCFIPAATGNRAAMTVLGSLYLNGQGVAKDLRLAFFWLSNAGEEGRTFRERLLKEHPGLKAADLGQDIEAPRLKHKPEPEYSLEARKMNFQGTVAIQLLIGEEGVPLAALVTRPLGLGLDEKAVAATMKWRFEPGKRGNEPVRILANLEVNFRIL